MRRFHASLLALALLLVAAPLSAYTIFLKDGTRLEARQKYRINGQTALITMPNGSETTLPLAQIDVPRTQAGNASDYGDARVVGGAPQAGAGKTPQGAPPQKESLADALAQGRSAMPAPAAPAKPRPAATAVAAESSNSGGGRTPAGYLDLMRLPRTPIARVEPGTTLGERLRAHGMQSAGIYQGSAPQRVLVDVTANSEGAVFQAIAATAQAVNDLETKQAGAIEGVELFIATDRRQRAGQFLVTPERARLLISKQLDLTNFYLKFVEF